MELIGVPTTIMLHYELLHNDSRNRKASVMRYWLRAQSAPVMGEFLSVSMSHSRLIHHLRLLIDFHCSTVTGNNIIIIINIFIKKYTQDLINPNNFHQQIS